MNQINKKYQFFTVIVSFIMLLSINVHSSNQKPLPAKAMLGIAPTNTTAGQHVVLRSVAPNSTASNMGLLANDELLNLNGDKIDDFSSLLALLSTTKVDQPVSFLIKRNNKEITLNGKMRARVREKSKKADVVYGTVFWNNQRLRTITYIPNSVIHSKEKAPAIFYIQGYTCDSVEYGLSPEVTTLQLINQFVDAGYVVYRTEKLAVGDSQGDLKCRDVDFTTEVAAFTASLKHFKRHPDVDKNKIYLWGHSLGVLFAPAIAKQESVAGIVGYGGVVKSWHDYILDIYYEQSTQYFSTDQRVAKENVNTIKPFVHDWLKTTKTWEEISKNENAISSGLLPINGQQVFSRHFSFFRDVNQYNFAEIWEELQVPTLMIHGSIDIQAINQSWAFDIAKAVNKGGSSLGKAVVIENAEHGFMHYENLQEYLAARANNQYNPGRPKDRFETKIGQITIDWIENLKK